ncbi:hypothetical protein SB768_32715, partial [Burkholderia sp. SIMBA_043]
FLNRAIVFGAGLSLDGTNVHVGAGGGVQSEGLGYIYGNALRIMTGAANTVGYTVYSDSGQQQSVTVKVSLQKRGNRYKTILYKASD